MRPPLEIAGVSLTPRVLFWAYKEATARMLESRLEMTRTMSAEYYKKHQRRYYRNSVLSINIGYRLDRILKEQEE